MVGPRFRGWVGAALAGGVAVWAFPSLVAEPQTVQFRGGTDIVAIDFLATQPDGQPVEDLSAKEIVLKVDGRVRDIRSFQFVKLSATSREVPAGAPILPAPFGANDAPAPGRIVIIVVDHEQTRANEGRSATAAAARFLDWLTPLDRAGLVTMPNGKVEVDLTTNHDRVRKALGDVVGRAQRKTGISNISLDEAMTVLAERIDPDKTFTQELIDRECRFAPADSACRTRVVQDALQIARETEVATRSSLRALKEFLDGIAGVEGPKSILYLSGSLVAFPETRLDLEDVARAAARARAQMFIVQPHETIADAGTRDQPPSATADMNRRLSGLEDLAGVTGGELFRISGLGDLVFSRIADEISSHYLLGFEPKVDEVNGKPHKIEITATRANVSIRARPMFIVDDARRTPPPPLALETLLRDVAAYRDLPLRATAYAFRDVDPKLVKIVVVVEPTEATTTLTSAAFALINLQGQAAAQWTEEGAILTARPVLSGASVPPGDYRLRVVAVDAAQRRGAVDYEFAARLTGGAPVTFGSLMVGSNEQGRFRARLLFEPGVETLTGYTEFYGTLPSGSSVTAKFEIAGSADGPALSSAAGVIQATSVASRFIVTGDVPAAGIGPGDHLLRAVISVNDKPVGRILRTFRKKN